MAAAVRAGATWSGVDAGTLAGTVADAGVEDDGVALALLFLRLFLPMVGRFVGFAFRFQDTLLRLDCCWRENEKNALMHLMHRVDRVWAKFVDKPLIFL